MIATQKLSNLQLELIKVFSYQLNDAQLFEIKDILAKYFAEKATQEMEILWNEKKLDNSTMDTLAIEHLLTSDKE